MAQILADYRWIGPHGIGRFASGVLSRLDGIEPVPNEGRPMQAVDPIRLHRLLKRLRPGAFFSPGFNAPYRSPVPFVFTIHDLIHVRVAAESSVAKRAYYAAFIRPAVRRAHTVLTVSEFSRREICQWASVSEDRVLSVGCGVDEHFCPQGPRHAPPYPYLFVVGAHKPHKNLPGLLAAFAQAATASEVRLVLTGRADEPLLLQARRLGIEQRLVFAGLVSEEELPAYYRGARALLIPSFYEGFGLPALEAMACGTPVIASNVTALPEVVGDAGLLIDPASIPAMAGAMERILQDSCLRMDLSARGLVRAKQFSWPAVAQRVGQVLRKAAGL